jgi:hypothetical protein
MTGAQLIDQTRITHVWRALGGGEIRHGRGRAFWREGDGYNVAINDKIGAWHDFVTDDKGGKLALIRYVRGGTKSEAVRWLADMRGVTLDNAPLSMADKRRYAQARERAPELARAAEIWFIERREELERVKARALAREDWAALEAAAREHHRLSRLDGAAIIREYLRARRADPAGTAALVAEGETWARLSEALVTALIARWAREADTGTEVAA